MSNHRFASIGSSTIEDTETGIKYDNIEDIEELINKIYDENRRLKEEQ